MGALNRATVMEVEDLVRNDPAWWGDFCGEIAERGQEALRVERDVRGWSWSALWRWIVGDVERYRDYMQALEAYAQDKALETVGIADGADALDPAGVSKAKLQVDTRFRLAGKMDRVRWGEKVEVSGKVEHRHSLIGILSGITAEGEVEDVEVLPAVEIPALLENTVPEISVVSVEDVESEMI